ncbi:hypothetical protein NC651_017218 [Populus alba x Populus x berolinensis]|nr:hypothetical protein NC651_017218 [Populus alba x Populus x berolinensis]
MLPEVGFKDFRIGSQFWVLTRKHARMVVRDIRIWPKFNQTCLREDTSSVDWSVRVCGHPREYKAYEVGPDLIMSLRNKRPRYGYEEINGYDLSVMKRNDPFLFARKFSPDSIQSLIV